MSKYYQMVEGLGRWEEHFQDTSIVKTAARIEKRARPQHPYVPSAPCSSSTSTSTPQENRAPRFPRSRKPRTRCFPNQSLHSFARLLSPKLPFSVQKMQAAKLQIKAVNEYGVTFSKRQPQDPLDVRLNEFKERDRNILDQFIGSMPPSRPIT